MFTTDAHCDTLYSLAVSHETDDLMITPERLRAGDVGIQTFAMFAGSKGPADHPYEKAVAMLAAAKKGFINATDCADYLTKKGVPFRDAHAVVGRLVAHCLNENKALLDLTLPELQQFHPAFEADVFDDLSMLACVEKRRIPGAPAPDMVQQAIDWGRKQLEA